MNREPSIHITESLLKKLISVIFSENPKILPKDLANELLLRGKKHSLSNRNLLVSNDRHAKQAEKITKAALDETMIMAKIIYQVRRLHKHRGIEISTPGSRDWPFIKNITKNALEFANESHPDCESLTQPFKAYIELMFKEIRVFSLAKVQSMHTKIMENYQANIELSLDNHADITDRAYREYNKLLIDQTGILLVDYKKDPKQYKFFMDVAKDCKELKVTPEHYIKAQFEGLAWANGIPQPTQLIGPKAKERLQKYLFENKIQLGSKSDEKNYERINRLKNLKQKK